MTADAPRACYDGGPLPDPARLSMTLTAAFVRTATTRGDVPIVHVGVGGGETVQSYGQLFEQARRVAGGLRAAGFVPRDRVILHVESLRDYFAGLWGCVLVGVQPITISVAPSYHTLHGVTRKLLDVWRTFERPVVLTSEHLTDAVAGVGVLAGGEPLAVRSIAPMLAHAPVDAWYEPAPTDVAYLQLTSGSTGEPKCVEETHWGIVSDLESFGHGQGSGPEDVNLNWFPMDHILPLMSHHMKALYFGGKQVQVRTDAVLANAELCLDLLERHRVSHTWSPNFGLKLLTEAAARSERQRDLSALRCFLTAGEPIRLDVVEAFLAALHLPPRVLQPAYGMTECQMTQGRFDPVAAIATFRRDSLAGRMVPAERGDAASKSFVSVGKPQPGVEVRVVDDGGAIVSEGVIGHIQARKPHVSPSYFPGRPVTPALAATGWFETGDRGFGWRGELAVTGRDKEMIIVRGHNVFCQDIEALASRVEGVVPTAVGACGVEDPAAATEGFCVFFVPADPAATAAVARQIRITVTAELGIAPTHVIPLASDELPRTTSGKLQRAILRRGLQLGSFRDIIARTETERRIEQTRAHVAPRSELEREIAVVWQQVLQLERVGVDDNFFDLGGSSLLLAQVIERLSRIAGREISTTDMFRTATVRAMARFLDADATDDASAVVESRERGERRRRAVRTRRRAATEPPA